MLNPTDILAFTCEALDHFEPVTADRNGIPQSGWQESRLIRAGAALARMVIDIAAEGCVRFSIAGEDVCRIRLPFQPEAREGGLLCSWEVSTLLGNSMSFEKKTSVFAYPSQQAQSLCQGRWTSFAFAQFRANPRSLLPKFQRHADGADLIWNSPFQARLKWGLLRLVLSPVRWLAGGLNFYGMRFFPSHAEFLVSGLVGLVLPKIVW